MLLVFALLLLQPLDAEETIFIDETNAEEAEATFEELAWLAANPVNFAADDLASLSLIPDVPAGAVESIQRYVRVFGPPHNENELSAIERVDTDIAVLLRPYILYPSLDRTDRQPLGGQKVRPAVVLVTSLRRPFEPRAGFRQEADTTAFLGGVSAYRTRVELQAGRHIRGRFFADHDPGEAFVWHPTSGSFGFDFVSTGIEIIEIGPVKRLLAGDFILKIGYGLVAWSGARRSGSTGSRIPAPRGKAITAKTGSSENDFLRGVAVEFELSKSLGVTAFASKRHHDGSNTSGLHRSIREQSGKGEVTESYRGVLLRLTRSSLTTTATLVRIKSTEIEDGGVTAGGLTLTLRSRSVEASAEAALHSNGRPSWIVALSFGPQPWFEVGSLIRWYPSTSGGAGPRPVAAGSMVAGTTPGWLTSLRFRHGIVRLSFFRDILASASFTATRVRPEVRTTLGAEFTLKHRGSDLTAGVLRDTREWQVSIDGKSGQIRGLEEETRFRIGLKLRLAVAKSIRARLTLLSQSTGDDHGSALTHEWRWRPSSIIDLTVGLAVFAGPSSVYTYEPSVRLQYSLIQLAGNGSRVHLMARLEISPSVEVQVKYGQTAFGRHREIGSGLDYLRTDRLRQLTVSLRMAM